MTVKEQLIRVGHSPDPDDAFMFHALANAKIDTGPLRFAHEQLDIETLNRRALSGDFELSAVSLHAYGYLSDIYAICSCGASMGDRYGPLVVAPSRFPVTDLRAVTVAVPGTLTTAHLALRLCLATNFAHAVIPFDQILPAVVRGSYQGQPIGAGLIIHEGQLTYGSFDLKRIVDLGQWWHDETGLPLPLGVNVVRKDLGAETMSQIDRVLYQSIRYGLDHRAEALDYALQFGRDLDRQQADRFVGMYVNDWTLDFGPRGRAAVAELLTRGHAARVIPRQVEPEFVGH
ncbi:MAG: ABC transporter substrate-binding protein [Planctomycetes bacterium RBG_16_64_10]|nr:MAG: ABC transporter substrate-binding protein [Planctomycetes bacterium RBG_16_64_10]